jgi:hypothetical protein
MADPKPAELSRPPEKPPPELGYRCAQGRRLDLVDNCFWHLGDIGALANVRFGPKAAVRWTLPHFLRRGLAMGAGGVICETVERSLAQRGYDMRPIVVA